MKKSIHYAQYKCIINHFYIAFAFDNFAVGVSLLLLLLLCFFPSPRIWDEFTLSYHIHIIMFIITHWNWLSGKKSGVVCSSSYKVLVFFSRIFAIRIFDGEEDDDGDEHRPTEREKSGNEYNRFSLYFRLIVLSLSVPLNYSTHIGRVCKRASEWECAVWVSVYVCECGVFNIFRTVSVPFECICAHLVHATYLMLVFSLSLSLARVLSLSFPIVLCTIFNQI